MELDIIRTPPPRFLQTILTANLAMKQTHLIQARFLSPSNSTRQAERCQLRELFYQFVDLVWRIKWATGQTGQTTDDKLVRGCEKSWCASFTFLLFLRRLGGMWLQTPIV